jgi:hypothetical protein
LQKARADYAAIIERHNRMLSRRRALEAAMLSMPDQLDEIYQTIMTLPVNEDVGARLEEAIGKLRLQEDIEADLASDLAEAVARRGDADRGGGRAAAATGRGRQFRQCRLADGDEWGRRLTSAAPFCGNP